MNISTPKGKIQIPHDIIAMISGYAALNCFGVKAMTARGLQDELLLFIKGESFHRGVKVRAGDGSVSIELHIAVEHGMNLKNVSRSIMEEVRYVVEKQTGIKVSRVDVFIDTIIIRGM